MVRADYIDRPLVTAILSKSFADNKSVNYIVKQDEKKAIRLKCLMEYSFDVCHLFGEVFLTEDRNGCALITYPERKKTTLKSILLDIRLIARTTGLANVKKAMQREAAIKKIHPKGLLYYLWFIGVEPSKQGKGIGSSLLTEVVAEGLKQERTICLETSTEKNIPWYKQHGFATYKQLDFGYKLVCMKRE